MVNPDGAAEAVGPAAQLPIVSGAAPTEDVGLQRALDLAAARRGVAAGACTQAKTIFVTRHTPTRQLAKRRTVRVRPKLFMPWVQQALAKPAEVKLLRGH